LSRRFSTNLAAPATGFARLARLVLRAVEFDWETMPQYMDRLDQHLGVNVGTMIGHSAVRYYVMGDDCQKRAATADETRALQAVVRDGMAAGALGLSVSREPGHYDPQGVRIPALWASEEEIFALGDVLRDLGTGLIQVGGGRYVEMKNQMMARLAETTGRTVVYNSLSQTVRRPNEWRELMARVDETAARGVRAYVRHAAAFRMGARKADHVAGAGSAPPDLRLRRDLRDP
jgi:N-acyl-D-amino-acid deacylase